jgi:hypothetical protein
MEIQTNSQLFRDPRSDDDTLMKAVSAMSSAEEATAQLWTDVANAPQYRRSHRNLAVRELLRRHLAKPSSLAQAASLLAGGSWLGDAVVEKIEVMGGEAVVRIPSGGAGFVIRLPVEATGAAPSSGLYLALDHDLDATTLREVLMSRNGDPALGRIQITDVAWFTDAPRRNG